MNNFILALMVWLNVAAPGQSKNDQYCNARFGYCIDYPSGTLIPQHEAANGDGRKFTGRNGEVVLTVFGRLNQDVEGNAISFEKQYSSDLAALQKEGAITYKKLTGSYYVISGQHKTGKIFYHKDAGMNFRHFFYELRRSTGAAYPLFVIIKRPFTRILSCSC